MAKLTREEILKLAKLSRLHLSEDEINSFQTDISEILNYVEQLKEVNLDNIKPTYQVTGLESVTRKDEIIDYGQTPDQLLKNAPEFQDDHIKVKRML